MGGGEGGGGGRMFVSSFYRLHTSCLRDVGVIYQETFST